MIKAVAFLASFNLRNEDGTPNVADTPTCWVAKDEGAYAVCTGTPGQRHSPTAGDTNSWHILLSATEMNADVVVMRWTADGCLTEEMVIVPEATWLPAVAAHLDAAVSDIPTNTEAAVIDAAILAAIAAVQARFAQAVLSPISPVSVAGDITLYRGIDYASDLGNAVEFALPLATHGNLTDATVVLETDTLNLEGEIINGGGASQLVRFELDHDLTAALEAGDSRYMLLATFDVDRTPTPRGKGTLTVLDLPQPVAIPSQ